MRRLPIISASQLPLLRLCAYSATSSARARLADPSAYSRVASREGA